jgi:hypothetical protein
MLKLSLIRTEGIQESIELLIQSESTNFCSSLSNSNFLVPKGIPLRLNIINSSDKSILCTSCFSTDLLPTDDFQWLPFSSNPKEVFKSLPVDVKKPRLLVFVSETLTPVKELSESESEDSENQKKKLNFYSDLKNSHSKELEYFKAKYEEAAAQASSLKLQLKKLAEDFEEHKNNAKLREEFLESLINEKIKESKKNLTLETKNSTSPDGEKENHFLMKKQEKTSLQTRIKSQESNKRTSSEHFERNNPRSTHQALQEFIKKNKPPGKIIKDADNLYNISGRKVFITLKNGNLLVRVGGGFEQIEDFMKKSLLPRVASHKRASTASSVTSLRS